MSSGKSASHVHRWRDRAARRRGWQACRSRVTGRSYRRSPAHVIGAGAVLTGTRSQRLSVRKHPHEHPVAVPELMLEGRRDVEHEKGNADVASDRVEATPGQSDCEVQAGYRKESEERYAADFGMLSDALWQGEQPRQRQADHEDVEERLHHL